mmetsp:Transcript_29165/g.54594  ORF Transcript_29165/g.54594 Transcript_29165/m.54594 type:complete len:219 (-) Transcript_29165:264-920(-)
MSARGVTDPINQNASSAAAAMHAHRSVAALAACARYVHYADEDGGGASTAAFLFRLQLFLGSVAILPPPVVVVVADVVAAAAAAAAAVDLGSIPLHAPTTRRPPVELFSCSSCSSLHSPFFSAAAAAAAAGGGRGGGCARGGEGGGEGEAAAPRAKTRQGILWIGRVAPGRLCSITSRVNMYALASSETMRHACVRVPYPFHPAASPRTKGPCWQTVS